MNWNIDIFHCHMLLYQENIQSVTYSTKHKFIIHSVWIDFIVIFSHCVNFWIFIFCSFFAGKCEKLHTEQNYEISQKSRNWNLWFFNLEFFFFCSYLLLHWICTAAPNAYNDNHNIHTHTHEHKKNPCYYPYREPAAKKLLHQ